MSVQISTLPEPRRDGVGVVLASTWSVGTPERQKATVAAITRAWESRDWPHEGLLSYSVHIGTDGSTLLHYSQWRDLDAYEEFVASAANGRDGRNAEIDAAVPGIERQGLAKYEPYRGRSLNERAERADSARVPGCIVIVDVRFTGPDPARQRAWVDSVFAALDGDEPHPGGISAHFHTSLDGTRVLNYAEWESEQAHVEALATPGEGVGAATEAWRRVQRHPGLAEGGSVKRYLPGVSFSQG
ncbi:antibiotic biosynthesis monooxygenase [Streptomyces cavernicola]|uniref:Antibiotic biosynthesis monooxygenase n=1 Tax=Streptomyces cavernicola TaxID=3043613 RepID=A0ABT6SA77_9ACTN|nr:antibiotic biosynthesis monooxygenase [Streptomyces sp. B-S-A6]MDI3404865.1 antibiotic biosynthesis monooxygenase [Streptomyces sp. B-S-A6]